MDQDSGLAGVMPRGLLRYFDLLGSFRLRWNPRTTLGHCFVVLLVGKPVPTFPEAL